MRISTIIITVAALAVSVLTAFMIQWYLGSRTPTAQIQKEIIPAKHVLVLKVDLSGGTVLKAKDHFKWMAWPDTGVQKDFVIKGSDVDKKFGGAILRRDMKAGLPLTSSLIYREGEMGFLASGLKPGMRAVAVKIDPVVGAGGFVTPGDRVDIILSTTITLKDKRLKRQIRMADEPHKVSETILRNIRILAINQNAESAGKKSKRPKTATLEVTEKQAEILANARRMGKLFFALRSHVPAEEVASERRFPFTTDLEIMSAGRGGLAAHLDQINRSAVIEFGLDRWLGGIETKTANVKAVARPTPAARPKPVVVAPKPAVRPKPVVVAPKPAARPKPVVVAPKPVKKKTPEPKPVVKSKPAPAPVATAAKPPPPPPSVVRIDRAGKVQTLKFKGVQ